MYSSTHVSQVAQAACSMVHITSLALYLIHGFRKYVLLMHDVSPSLSVPTVL